MLLKANITKSSRSQFQSSSNTANQFAGRVQNRGFRGRPNLFAAMGIINKLSLSVVAPRACKHETDHSLPLIPTNTTHHSLHYAYHSITLTISHSPFFHFHSLYKKSRVRKALYKLLFTHLHHHQSSISGSHELHNGRHPEFPPRWPHAS